MSKLHAFSIGLMVLAASSWPLDPSASATQGQGSSIDRHFTRAAPIAIPIEFKHAQYYLKTFGKKAKPVGGTLVFEPNAKAVRFVAEGKIELDVSNSSITKLQYEPTTQPRYVLAVLVSKYFLLTKSTKHFLTIEYKRSDGETEAAVIRLNKTDYEAALATAEAQTGLRVERIPER